MPAGLSGGVITTNRFCAKSTRPVTPTLSLTSSMYVPLAEAKTSAVPSDSIDAARSPDEPKLNVTVVPGFAASKSDPICVKAAVSDDAANTVSSVAWCAAAPLAPPEVSFELHAPSAKDPQSHDHQGTPEPHGTSLRVATG